MKTLYITDLDGTLLQSNERVSTYSAMIINRFIQRGGYFSYATARSIITASKATAGVNIELPVICANGAFIIESKTREITMSNFFSTDEVGFISSALTALEIYPLTYALIEGAERVSYIGRYVTNAARYYLDSRSGDPRLRVVQTAEELYLGSVFCFACLDTETRLIPAKGFFEPDTRFSSLYTKEIYSGEELFEIRPEKATKARAALQLKATLGCDRMIVFGDERNDLSLFAVADEKYATANAVPELKEIATAVIDSNDNDGVAKWLEANVL